MLKFIRTIFISAFLVALTCSISFAQSSFYPQGSAITTVWTYYAGPTSFQGNSLMITNITDDSIQCRITIYDHNGNKTPTLGQVYTGSESVAWNVLESGVEQFEIPPNATRRFVYSKRKQGAVGSLYGKAIIEWSSDNLKCRKALIVKSITIGMSGQGNCYSSAVLLNNGQPF